MKERIAIIGSGDLGQLIAYHAVNSCGHDVVGFFDDYKAAGDFVNEIPVLGKRDDLMDFFNKGEFNSCMLGIGYKHMQQRASIFSGINLKIPFAKLIHPSCIIDRSVLIGEGTFLLPGCILDKGVELGKNVLLNTGCVIAHDSVIGDNTFLSPAVKIAGFTKVGNNCVIGINTTIIDNIKISDNIRTGGGTVVIKDLKDQGLYVGNPARFIK